KVPKSNREESGALFHAANRYYCAGGGAGSSLSFIDPNAEPKETHSVGTGKTIGSNSLAGG
ncbi:hypothetical protein PoMZ_10106, partial [Pyricularia oryzae]